MDNGKTLEARLLGRDSVVLGVVLLLCVYCICCTCYLYDVVHMWCCVYIVCVHVVMQCYVQGGTNSVV